MRRDVSRSLPLTCLGALFFLWFFYPVTIRVFHIGNATGMGLSLLLMGYGLFFRPVNARIRLWWRHRVGRVLLIGIAAAAAGILLLAAATLSVMAGTALSAPEPDATVIVLGCQVKGSRPSRLLSQRIDRAYEYLIDHPDARCIVSGGRGSGEDITEAACMARELTARGIDPARILLEERSTNTEENIAFSQAVLEENGLSPHVVIVTNWFHSYRGCYRARQAGLIPSSAAAPTSPGTMPAYVIREMYGILAAWFLS